MINKKLNIFIKYNDNAGLDGIKTMNEHLKVYVDKGKVIWGHFTKTKPNKNKIGLWNQRTPLIDKQLDNNEPTFVFFYSRATNELYIGNLIGYYDRDYPDNHKEILEYIPKYYHDRVGSINEKTDIGTMRSYAFLEVTNLRKVDFNDTDYIYNFKGDFEQLGQEKVLDSKGMASLLYINLEQEYYDKQSQFESLINILQKYDLDFSVGKLINNTIPPKSKKQSIDSSSFVNETANSYNGNGKKHTIKDDIKNNKLGVAGELLVLKLEQERVMAELGEKYKVEHVSQTKGDNEGFDILSWDKLNNGEIVEKYIEVKTTESGYNAPFFISSGEVSFSKVNSSQYYLYRVYNYNKKTGNADFYILKGSMEELNLVPKNFAAYFENSPTDM